MDREKLLSILEDYLGGYVTPRLLHPLADAILTEQLGEKELDWSDGCPYCGDRDGACYCDKIHDKEPTEQLGESAECKICGDTGEVFSCSFGHEPKSMVCECVTGEKELKPPPLQDFCQECYFSPCRCKEITIRKIEEYNNSYDGEVWWEHESPKDYYDSLKCWLKEGE